jgi:hypothetical protein
VAQPLVSRIGASPLWRAGLASAFILGLAGFAAGVIPSACRAGFVICQANAPAPISADVLGPGVELITPAPKSAEPVADVAPAEQAPAAVATIDTAMAKQQPATLTRNDLIAQTFAALDVEMVSTPGELVARKVRTVTIGPDGMPVLQPAAPVEVAAAPVELVAEPAPVTADVQVADAEPPAAVAEEPVVAEEEPTASAYAPVRGGSATVGRQGANVRSAPATRGSDVLFALASGEDVTVTQTSKGWSKVVDSRGRSGWVWNELLRR